MLIGMICSLFIRLPIVSTLEGGAVQEAQFENMILSRVVPRNESAIHESRARRRGQNMYQLIGNPHLEYQDA